MTAIGERVMKLDRLYLAADAATSDRISSIGTASPKEMKRLRQRERRAWNRYHALVKEPY